MQDATYDELAERIERLLEEDRVHDALELVNSSTGHRFTGVYRVDDEVLRNVALFDSANPDLAMGEDAPLLETYCSITTQTEAPFCTRDTATDSRVQHHPARDTTRSYCGVPLRLGDGEPFGTLCHFDAVPRAADERDIRLLARVAPLFARRLRSEHAPPEAAQEGR